MSPQVNYPDVRVQATPPDKVSRDNCSHLSTIDFLAMPLLAQYPAVVRINLERFAADGSLIDTKSLSFFFVSPSFSFWSLLLCFSCTLFFPLDPARTLHPSPAARYVDFEELTYQLTGNPTDLSVLNNPGAPPPCLSVFLPHCSAV
jgi:hypothetical protein